eukprot:gene15075-16630_t
MALLEGINTLTIVCHFIRSAKLEKTQAAKNKAKNEVLQATKILKEIGGSSAKIVGIASLFFVLRGSRKNNGNVESFGLFDACCCRMWFKTKMVKTKMVETKMVED